MKKAILEAHSWVKGHPFKACLFSVFTAALAVWEGTRPYLTTMDFAMCGWLLIVIMATVYTDMKRAITLLLLACFLLQPFEARAQPRKEPAGGGVIIVVLVIVVGGIIIFRMARFCQRAFPRTPPPNTNAPPSLALNALPNNCALTTSCSALGSCYVPSSALAVESPQTIVEVSGVVAERPEGGFMFQIEGVKQLATETEAVDMMEFAQEMVPWGVRLGSAGETFYGLNGQPSTADQVPLSVTLNGAVTAVTGNGGQATFAFERSEDLVHWEPMLTMILSAGQKLKFADATSGQQMFYRGRTVVGD